MSMRKIFYTRDDWSLTVLRLILGIVFFAHGAQKALGWFGGPGFDNAMDGFTRGMNIPPVFAALAIAAEFLGGLGLIAGFLGRVAAAGIAVNMVVAIVLVHAPMGFFMNWTGRQPGEGYEYHLLAIAAAVVILVQGSGALSLDRALMPYKVFRDEHPRPMEYPAPEVEHREHHEAEHGGAYPRRR